MSYKTNYELYARNSHDVRRQYPSEAVLNPLGTLYPHVSALQLQSESDAWASAGYSAGYLDGYHNMSYWAGAFADYPLEDESKSCRNSDFANSRFVNKLRRLIKRETRTTNNNTTVEFRKRFPSTSC